jgi:hypothetical protein
VAWWRKAWQNDGDDDRIKKVETRLNSRQSGFRPVDLIADIAKLKTDKGVYITQNTAYIAYGGKILKYHKYGNFNEVEGDENDRSVVFAPGSASGRFNIGPSSSASRSAWTTRWAISATRCPRCPTPCTCT